MKRIWVVLGVAGLSLFCLAPFLWSLVTSLKTPAELLAVPPTWVPHHPTLANYVDVFVQRPFARYLLNSLIVGLLSTLIAMTCASLAAYALARLRLRGTTIIEYGLLFFALWPPAVLLVPLYLVGRSLGLLNSLVGLSLAHAALNLPFAAWMLTAFFRQVPAELEEAARVDGLSRLQFLRRILLPLVAPAMAATALLVFIFSWNEFVIALTFIVRDNLRTVPVGIAMLTGITSYDIPWGQISAAVVMTTLPVVAAVLACQRWIISGLTAGALKG